MDKAIKDGILEEEESFGCTFFVLIFKKKLETTF